MAMQEPVDDIGGVEARGGDGGAAAAPDASHPQRRDELDQLLQRIAGADPAGFLMRGDDPRCVAQVRQIGWYLTAANTRGVR